MKLPLQDRTLLRLLPEASVPNITLTLLELSKRCLNSQARCITSLRLRQCILQAMELTEILWTVQGERGRKGYLAFYCLLLRPFLFVLVLH